MRARDPRAPFTNTPDDAWVARLLLRYGHLFERTPGDSLTGLIDCGPGWSTLIESTCRRIESLLAEHPQGRQSARLLSLREKYGALRMRYRGPSCPALDTLAEDLLNRSRTICERCGQPARPFYLHGWALALCVEHFSYSLIKHRLHHPERVRSWLDAPAAGPASTTRRQRLQDPRTAGEVLMCALRLNLGPRPQIDAAQGPHVAQLQRLWMISRAQLGGTFVGLRLIAPTSTTARRLHLGLIHLLRADSARVDELVSVLEGEKKWFVRVHPLSREELASPLVARDPLMALRIREASSPVGPGGTPVRLRTAS